MSNAFLDAYQAAKNQNQQSDAANLNLQTGQMGLLSKIKAQQEQQKVQEILTSSPDQQTAMTRLSKGEGGLTGIQVAQHLSGLIKSQTEAAQAQREQAVFAPENIKKFMTPGPSTPPTTPVDDQGNPNPPVAGEPQLNVGALRQAAAMTGPKGFEAYQAHLDKVQAQKDANDMKLITLQEQISRADLDRAQRAEIAAQMVDVRRAGQAIQAQLGQGNQELRRMQITSSQEQKQAQQATQNVQKLQVALEKANLPEAETVLSAAKDAIAKNPNIAEYITGPKSAIPDMFVSPDIAAGRQAFRKLFNITLKNRSGSAVTTNELERLKGEFAAGVWKKPEQLVSGLSQAEKVITKHYASVAAGFGPDTLKSYNENLTNLGGNVVLGGSTPSVDALLEKYK